MRDKGRGSSWAAIILGSRFALLVVVVVAVSGVVSVVPGGGLSSSSRIEPEASLPLCGISCGDSLNFGLRYSGEDGSRIGGRGSFSRFFRRKMRSNKET